MEKYTELHGLNDELNDAHDIDEVAHPDVYAEYAEQLDKIVKSEIKAKIDDTTEFLRGEFFNHMPSDDYWDDVIKEYEESRWDVDPNVLKSQTKDRNGIKMHFSKG